MKVTALLVSIVLTLAAAAQDPQVQPTQPPPATTVGDLQDLSRSMQSLQALVRNSSETQQRLEQELRVALQNAQTEGAREDLARRAQQQQLDRSYDAGARVLDHISGATRTVSFAERLLLTEVHLEQVTNPWGNQTLRNTWDRVDGLGSSLGLALAGAAAFGQENGELDSTALGSGLLIAVASRLVGHFWGGESSQAFRKQAEFVEFTRRAYDDLNDRNEFMTTFITQNQAFLSRLAAFAAEYAEAAHGRCASVTSDQTVEAKTRACKAQVLLQIDEYIGQFDQVLDQIPAVLSLYDKLLTKYDEKKLSDQVLVGALKSIRAEIEELRKEYQAVRSFLNVRPELEATLLAWRNPALLPER